MTTQSQPRTECGDCGDEAVMTQPLSGFYHAGDKSPVCAGRDHANRRRKLQGRPNVGERALCEIADEITAMWRNPYFGAEPYIRAMRRLARVDQAYGATDGRDIVTRFLINAKNWRGEDARRIKAELRRLAK